MAMLTQRIVPIKFKNNVEDDAETFLENFFYYAKVFSLSTQECVYNFRICLIGDAAVWLRTIKNDVPLEDVVEAFKGRWCRKNKVLNGLNELADVDVSVFTDVLSFLDHMKSVTIRAGIPEIVAMGNVLRKLPVEISDKLLLNCKSGEMDFDYLYESLNKIRINLNNAADIFTIKTGKMKKEEKNNYNNKKTRKCLYCGKKGHTENYCYDLIERSKQKNQGRPVHVIKQEVADEENNEEFINKSTQ